MGLRADNQPEQQPAGPVPLDVEQRLIIQNIFDEQPRLRMKYLEQLGYEMNPNDDNLIRPLGTKGPWKDEHKDLAEGVEEIDPGLGTEFGMLAKGEFAKFGKEQLKDVGDMTFEALIAGPAIAGGASAGTKLAGGTVAPAVVTGPKGVAATGIAGGVGAVAGGILGGALGFEVASTAKNILAQTVFLNDFVPIDQKLNVMQAIMAGAGNEAGKLVFSKAGDKFAEFLEKRANSVARASQLGLTKEGLDMAARQPELFTEEAIAGAGKRVLRLRNKLFGLEKASPDDIVDNIIPRRIRGGAFGKRLGQLIDEQKTAERALDAVPEAAISREDLIRPLWNKFNQLLKESNVPGVNIADPEALTKKGLKAATKNVASKERRKALKLISEKIIAVRRNIGDSQDIPHSKARDVLRQLQDDAFPQGKTTFSKAERELQNAISGAKGSGGLLEVLNKKAAGTNLEQINNKIGKLNRAYNNARREFHTRKITKAALGKEEDAARQAFEGAAKDVDQVLGADLLKAEFGDTLENQSKLLSSQSGVSHFLSAYKGKSPIIEGAKTGLAAGGLSAPFVGPEGAFGIGLTAAGGRIVQTAPLRSPEAALKSVQRSIQGSDALRNFAQQQAPRTLAGVLTGTASQDVVGLEEPPMLLPPEPLPQTADLSPGSPPPQAEPAAPNRFDVLLDLDKDDEDDQTQ